MHPQGSVLCSPSSWTTLALTIAPPGIYPREPKNRKKANKGSSAPASFYYAKDIQYLLHEPVLHKLREHKAFAKKLSKAVGRGEYGLAKNLEEQKPTYRLDHIIKERSVYATLSCRSQVLTNPVPAAVTRPSSTLSVTSTTRCRSSSSSPLSPPRLRSRLR